MDFRFFDAPKTDSTHLNTRVEYSDPNPQLEKHPMSLEASQSSRKSTQRETPDPSQGVPPRTPVLCLEDTEWILKKIARLRGSSDAFRAPDSDPNPGSAKIVMFGKFG